MWLYIRQQKYSFTFTWYHWKYIYGDLLNLQGDYCCVCIIKLICSGFPKHWFTYIYIYPWKLGCIDCLFGREVQWPSQRGKINIMFVEFCKFWMVLGRYYKDIFFFVILGLWFDPPFRIYYTYCLLCSYYFTSRWVLSLGHL